VSEKERIMESRSRPSSTGSRFECPTASPPSATPAQDRRDEFDREIKRRVHEITRDRHWMLEPCPTRPPSIMDRLAREEAERAGAA